MEARTILVVDDDLLVRINIAATFEEAGFEVIEACDGWSALEVLQECSGIQLVCTDVHMPGEVNGIELVARIIEHHPDIKVIVLSEFGQPLHALPPGIPFMAKPFVSERLVGLARERLGAPT